MLVQSSTSQVIWQFVPSFLFAFVCPLVAISQKLPDAPFARRFHDQFIWRQDKAWPFKSGAAPATLARLCICSVMSHESASSMES